MRWSLRRSGRIAGGFKALLVSRVGREPGPNALRFPATNEPRNRRIYPCLKADCDLKKQPIASGRRLEVNPSSSAEAMPNEALFSRNYNPRLAVAGARFLNSPVEFEFASPFSPGQSEKFLKLNPNLSVPILVGGRQRFWEADTIACRLSQLAKSDFWPLGDSLARRRPLDKLGPLEFRQGLRPGPFRARDQAALWQSARCDRRWCNRTGRIRLFGGHSRTASQRQGLARWRPRNLRRFPSRLRSAVRGPRGLPLADFPRVAA